MKRKPMLLNKVLEGKKNKKREVIGLIGAHSGAGVTYTGFLLAFYFGLDLGRRTAFLECNDHHDLSILQPVFEWSREGEDTFSFERITFFKEVRLDQIADILSDNYDCFVLDFGTDFEHNRDEFLRCSTKMILGGQAEWNRQRLKHFIEANQSSRGYDSWLHLVPFGNKNMINGLRNEINKIIYSVPFEADPTSPSKETAKLFDVIFH